VDVEQQQDSIPEEQIIKEALQMKTVANDKISNIKVGAVVVARNAIGEQAIFPGCNDEVSKTIRFHAEENALRNALMAGYNRIESVYVTSMTYSEDNALCPDCRGLFWKVNKYTNVIVLQPDGTVKLRTTVKALLPHWEGI